MSLECGRQAVSIRPDLDDSGLFRHAVTNFPKKQNMEFIERIATAQISSFFHAVPVAGLFLAPRREPADG